MLVNVKIACSVCFCSAGFLLIVENAAAPAVILCSHCVFPSLPLHFCVCFCYRVPGVGMHLSNAWAIIAPVVRHLISCRIKGPALAPVGRQIVSPFLQVVFHRCISCFSSFGMIVACMPRSPDFHSMSSRSVAASPSPYPVAFKTHKTCPCKTIKETRKIHNISASVVKISAIRDVCWKFSADGLSRTWVCCADVVSFDKHFFSACVAFS